MSIGVGGNIIGRAVTGYVKPYEFVSCDGESLVPLGVAHAMNQQGRFGLWNA
jgi:hypothetical protein